MRTHSFADLPGVPKRFNRFFWHTVRMSRFGPDIHFATSREIEDPYRVGKAVVLHLEPFRPGLVLGWYGKEGLPEFEALRRAVSLRDPTEQELRNFDENELHGPRRPTGLRFSATGGRPVGQGEFGGPEPAMGTHGHAGADR